MAPVTYAVLLAWREPATVTAESSLHPICFTLRLVFYLQICDHGVDNMGIQTPEYHRQWRKKNREKWNSYSRGYYLRNKSKVQRKRSTIEYRTRMALYLKDWRAKNAEKRRSDHKAWSQSHREHVRSYRKNYNPRRLELYRKNRILICKRKRELHPKYRSRIRAYFRLRRKTNIQFALADRLRATMNRALRRQFTRKSARTFDLIGCSPTELRAHIESLFLPGMSWDNRALWHVDHEKPLASFDLRDPVQQRQAFHYTNLQPLWAVDNQRKGVRSGAPRSSDREAPSPHPLV